MIGIIGAMEVEIKCLLERMEIVEVKEVGSIKFHWGTLCGASVLVAQCRVGKVNAAHATSVMLTNFDVKSIINVGVAGAVGAELNIGDVVVGTALVQHDVAATDFGYALGQVPGTEGPFFGACEDLVKTAEKAGSEVLASPDFGGGSRKLHVGRIATGDQFISSADKKAVIWNEFGALCAEMEGAAMAQVCNLMNVPFVAIRAISDKADGTAHEDFPAFVQETAKISSAIVMKMVG